jgi:hypothetical protein
MTLPRSARPGVLAAVCGLAALVVLAMDGCASPGGGASAHNDVARCAAVLPLARDVVHGQGTLTLVRPVDRGDVDALTQQAGAVPPPPSGPPGERTPKPSVAQAGPPLPKACLVVYRGSYPAGSIPHSLPAGASGQFALVIVKVRHPAVYRVLVTDALPPSAKRSWWHF